MNGLQVISGVKCYEENGIACLRLEDVARGLGFTTVATCGNEVVRWPRVKKYLSDFGVPTSGEASIATSCDDYKQRGILAVMDRGAVA